MGEKLLGSKNSLHVSLLGPLKKSNNLVLQGESIKRDTDKKGKDFSKDENEDYERTLSNGKIYARRYRQTKLSPTKDQHAFKVAGFDFPFLSKFKILAVL